MDKFQAIKGNISIYDVLNYYGYRIEKNHCKCMFHNDKTASMSFKNNKAHCFGCNWHGDCIDFVSKHDNIMPFEAVKLLNDIFNIGIEFNAPLSELDRLRGQIMKLTKERNGLKNSNAFSYIYHAVFKDRRHEYYEAKKKLNEIDGKLNKCKRILFSGKYDNDIDKFYDSFVKDKISRDMKRLIAE